MNERFGVDPEACSNHYEIRILLDKFGPFTGRYVTALPQDWEIRVRNMIRDWPAMESARAKAIINRAVERKALLRLDGIVFNNNQSWLTNAENALSKNLIDGIVASRENIDTHLTIDNLEFSPTTDEKIYATAEEYARVANALITISPEIFLIDPYLDPTKSDRFPVLIALFSIAAKIRIKRIVLWVSTRHVETPLAEIEKALKIIAHKSNLKNIKIEMNLVDDIRAEQRLHARYLLSIRGAIRFDQGFQALKEQKVDISVVGKNSHDDLVTTYVENFEQFKISQKISINV